jgi:hypothetical protein
LASPFAQADLEAWVMFRRAYGLRSDREWLIKVATDPSASGELSVPLLPGEVDAVARRDLAIQQLAPAVERYGELFPDEFAGSFIATTRVVIRFTARVSTHLADLKALFGGTAPIQVVEAGQSVADLERIASDIEADSDWFKTVGVTLVQAEVAVLTNGVNVVYRADDSSVEPVIVEHFGSPAWLHLERAGSPSWDGPRGSLRVMVVDATGHPIDVTCQITSLDKRVTDELLPRESMDGLCSAQGLPAVDWEIRASYEQGGTTTLAIARVHVPDGGVGTATIVVRP